MPQHDYDIANGAGATVRSDLNSVLAAIVSLNSGSSAPSPTFAYQLWADTTNGVLKRRNAANSAWLVAGALASAMVQAKSGSTTVLPADFGTLFDCTGTWTMALTASSSMGDGFAFAVRNSGTGVITIDPSSSETIDGASTILLNPGDSCVVVCNGSNWRTIGRALPSAGGSLQGALNMAKGASIASAGTTSIWATDGNTVHITGTTGISNFGTALQAGARRTLIFDGALTLTNGSNLILPGGANITTAAGDSCEVVAESTSQHRVVVYTRASGQALVSASSISAASQAEQEAASSTSVFVSPGRQQLHPSAMKAGGQVTNNGTATLAGSYNITSITRTGTGKVTVTIGTDFSGTSYWVVGRCSPDSGDKPMVFLVTSQSAGSFTVETRDNGNNLRDCNFGFACFGDQ